MRTKTLSFIILGLAIGLLIANLLPQRHDKHLSQKVEHKHNQHEDVYTCPMHPEIRQNEPGSCPICHMELVAVENDLDEREGSLELTIPIDPYQASLVGMKPIHPKKEKVNRLLPVYGTLVQGDLLGVQVFEEDLRNITIGLKFKGASAVYPEKQLLGEVIGLDPVLDPSTRTLRVLIRLHLQKAKEERLPIESSASGQLEIPLGEQLTLPEEAILFAGSGNYVYLYQEERLSPRKVILGAKIGERYVIVEGLNSTDVVSSGPNFLLDSEAKIRGLDDSKVD